MPPQPTVSCSPALVVSHCGTGNRSLPLRAAPGKAARRLEALGIRAVVPIADGPISLEQSLADASRLITDAAERTARLLRIGAELSGHF